MVGATGSSLDPARYEEAPRGRVISGASSATPSLDHDEEIWWSSSPSGSSSGWGGQGDTRGCRHGRWSAAGRTPGALSSLYRRCPAGARLPPRARDPDRPAVELVPRTSTTSSPTYGLPADAVLTSLTHGKTKPHDSISGPLLDRLGVAPQDAVMVGDTVADDVEGALAIGMRAVLVDREDRYPDFEGRLADLRLLPPRARARLRSPGCAASTSSPPSSHTAPSGTATAGAAPAIAKGGSSRARRGIGAALYELPAGERSFPYHFHHGNGRSGCVVVAERRTLRGADGERELRAGETSACFPAGPRRAGTRFVAPGRARC